MYNLSKDYKALRTLLEDGNRVAVQMEIPDNHNGGQWIEFTTARISPNGATFNFGSIQNVTKVYPEDFYAFCTGSDVQFFPPSN
jgi:predicted GNAT superfamily acetyltransferase